MAPMHARRNPFDRLIDDMLPAYRLRLSRAAKPRASKPTMMVADGLLVKAIMAGESILTQKRKVPIFVAKPESSVGEFLAKAFDSLSSDRLNADQRGRLMLAIANADSAPIRRAGRNAIAQLSAVERQLAAGATASHLDAAAKLVSEVKAILASGKLTDGEHAQLSLAINMIKDKLEGVLHAGS
jgi:hypothetical protein